MRAILIILFVFAGATLYSQAPGFMGRRFAVFIEGNPTPALFVPNSNNEMVYDMDNQVAQKNRFAFNFKPQVTVEYLVHRDISIGFSYSRISVGTTRAIAADSSSAAAHSYTYDADVLKGDAVGIHFKFYQFGKSASIAPIGFYHTLSGYLTRTNTYDNNSSSAKLFKNDFVYPVASYSVGRQSMIAKNLILKTGVEFGWAFVPFNFAKQSADQWTVQEYAGYSVHRSLFGQYLFNINIALGYAF